MVNPGVELIRRMATGDRDALATFYDLYAPLAFGLLRRMLRDVEEAAEVLQEVFWELWRAAGQYDPVRGSPEAWVTVRARSRGIDRMRSVRRREEMFVAPLGETTAAAPETRGDPVEDREMARGFLRELPAEQREVIALAYLRGMTQSEISARLGLPLGTVKTRMRLGMERLRVMAGSRT
ncbi:MAG TPA: sigma-70 family RNA polymerase sigma factor [Candidatus Limnocylindria bacterium]|nr:sigma-70 family RNA polymerase sigma factor [Candidatus Limnocylindria bacterium]